MKRRLLHGVLASTDSRFTTLDVAGVLTSSTGDNTRWGGTVGVSLEYGFAPNWSVGVEYDHLFMQDKTLAFTAPGGVLFQTDRIRQDVDLVTARVKLPFWRPGHRPLPI
jgi:outer membrane immunogenic protein